VFERNISSDATRHHILWNLLVIISVYYRLSDKARKGSGLFNPLAVLVCYQLLPLLDDLYPFHYNNRKLLFLLWITFISFCQSHSAPRCSKHNFSARHKKLQLHFWRKALKLTSLPWKTVSLIKCILSLGLGSDRIFCPYQLDAFSIEYIGLYAQKKSYIEIAWLASDRSFSMKGLKENSVNCACDHVDDEGCVVTCLAVHNTTSPFHYVWLR